jgi:hypothetical protein
MASPDHIFPITTIGKAPDTNEVLLSGRAVVAKKEILRIPANPQLLQSMSLWWPLITGALTMCAVSTLRKGLPAMGVDTWQDIMKSLLPLYSAWDAEKRVNMQAEVADECTDIEVGRYLAALLIGDVAAHLGPSIFCVLHYLLGDFL